MRERNGGVELIRRQEEIMSLTEEVQICYGGRLKKRRTNLRIIPPPHPFLSPSTLSRPY